MREDHRKTFHYSMRESKIHYHRKNTKFSVSCEYFSSEISCNLDFTNSKFFTDYFTLEAK